MRVLSALLVATAMSAGGARASSFVVIEAPKEKISASMIVLGEPAPVAAAAAPTLPAKGATTAVLAVPLAFPLAGQAQPPNFAAAAAKPATVDTAMIVPLAFPIVPQEKPVDVGQAGDTKMVKISASIVAFESVIPDIAYEKVAAITPDRPAKVRTPFAQPIVMRGGIIGDASVGAPVATAVAPKSPRAAEKTAARKPTSKKPAKDQPAEEPAPIVIAPPPSTMHELEGVR